jgi:hypothetical protein
MAKIGSAAPASLIVGTPSHTVFWAGIRGTLAFFLQKSVGFPLENNLAFHGLAWSRFLPEFVQASFHPIKKFLKKGRP